MPFFFCFFWGVGMKIQDILNVNYFDRANLRLLWWYLQISSSVTLAQSEPGIWYIRQLCCCKCVIDFDLPVSMCRGDQDLTPDSAGSVSYTHLTLPTKLSV